ncbi:MAG: DUF2080 family transposase-associated protein [Candidatus Methanoperedens sp.]|nr:DUF2080 family transposase-associated protein [Candidatus Methanoperedens sp.]
MEKKFQLTEKNYVEKRVGPHASSNAHVYVPREWLGKKVMVILLPEED